MPILAAVLLGFHYPITTVILLTLGLPTSQANLLIKGFIILLFLTALVFSEPKINDARRLLAPLFIFFLGYSIRLLYDVLALNIIGDQSTTYIFGYFFGMTVLPAVAISICITQADIERLHKWFFIAIILANVLLLFYLATSGLPSAEEAFAGRAEVSGAVEGTATINPILVGLMGAILAAFTLGRIALVRPMSAFQHVLHALLVLMGAANILMGASRGPALAFGLCFAVMIYTLIRGSLGLGKLRPSATLWLYGVALLAIVAYLILSGRLSIFLFDRFTMMFDASAGGHVEERNFIYAMAWNDFLGAPLFGSSYLVSVGNALAHNFLLDALMSTGIVGGVFLLLALFWSLLGILKLLHGEGGVFGYSIALIAICFLAVGSTSGSVGQTPELWMFLTLTTILGNRSMQSGRAREPARRLAGDPTRT